MKTLRTIREGIMLEINKKIIKTIVSIIVDGNKVQLCKVDDTDENFWVGYSFNENYLVVYSRGCMANQIPLKVEAVFDITNKRVISVTNKNKVIFEYLCIVKKGICLPVVLEFLNDSKLEVCDEDEVLDFVRYITAGNTDIANDAIKAYILKKHPFLEKFMDIQKPLTVKEYRKLVADQPEILKFHIMPHLLKEEYLN